MLTELDDTERGVKVTLDEALGWADKGFEIECYVVPPNRVEVKRPNVHRRTINNGLPISKQRIDLNKQFTLSRVNSGPRQGKSGATWKYICGKIFVDNPRAIVTYGRIRELVLEHGQCDPTLSAALVNKYKCLIPVNL